MGVTIPRFLGPVCDLEQGEYTKDTASGEPAVSCPSCGTIQEIDPQRHSTWGDGRVTPIWSCERCSFMDWINLESVRTMTS